MFRRRVLVPILLTMCVSLLGFSCVGQRILITAPGKAVQTFDFDVRFTLVGEFPPDSLAVELNGVDVLARFAVIERALEEGGPVIWSARFAPGAPLRDQNKLVVKAVGLLGGRAMAGHEFAYRPPGKARVAQIKKNNQRITGPLGHSKIGDWLLENGYARFVVQDVAQRELYSVGAFGGNLIDAELVGNEGKDNFLELQPGLNIESVINAQTVEVVNDGQDGTAAILRTCGPDDLLDFVNPSSQVADLGLPFPALSDDVDLEISGCTTYTLEPNVDVADPQDFVRVDTEVFNDEPPAGPRPNPLPLIVGDWLNPAGELDTVASSVSPPSGMTPRANGIGPPLTTTIGALGFFGFDEAEGTDYSYVQTAKAAPATFAFISGVLVVLHQENVLLALIGIPPSFLVPSGGSRTFTRYVGVGDGDGSNAFELEHRLNGTSVATLQGCVSVAGEPTAGARVTVGNRLLAFATPASDANSTEILGSFVTKPGPCPNYSGTVRSGAAIVSAAKKGHLYETRSFIPSLNAVTLVANGVTTVDFDLPAPGRLVVSTVDESGQPIPARVTVVGLDPSPEFFRAGPKLPGFGGSTLGVFRDGSDRAPFGLVAVEYSDATGVVSFDLEPEVDRYHVYVSRGTEYSAFRTADPVSIAEGETLVIDAQIARVVDTPGFISSDFHVHGIRSADSRVSDLHRLESYSAEGVENIIMTDHHVHTDLRPAIRDARLAKFLTATIGEEITTFDYGHFNAYPLRLDPQSPTATFKNGTQLSGGSTDWALAASPGRDFPIFGALNATPSEIFDLATTGSLSTAATTIQINHIGGHFGPLRIDTSLVPPSDGLSNAQRAQRRLPSRAAVPNLFHHFPALELWNGESRGSQAEFLNDRIGIWFNHLNQGMRTTFIADTDSHTFFNLRTAGARTWTASPTDDPWEIDPADVANAVDAGRSVGGQGVYVQTRLLATDGSQDVADLTQSGHTTMSSANGNVELEISIQSPDWAQWDQIEIYANAATFSTGSPYQFGATPTLTLDEGDCDAATTGDGDFDIAVTADVGGVPGADRLSLTHTVAFDGLAEDTWFVVVVKGTDGECAPMFPIYPTDLPVSGNTTLEGLSDGNVGERGVLALGATNALYFEQ